MAPTTAITTQGTSPIHTASDRRTDLRTIGRFEIVRELGRGGMGVVYLAQDPKIGRLVAIKTIHAADTEPHDAAYQRLSREAHSAGVLCHPGIVPVYELGEDGPITYIVMEYVAGTTLHDLMLHSGGCTTAQILTILEQVAAALDFAHSKGIVHRDIKPSNIMIDDQGYAKIADFGIAKVLGGATQTMTVSTVGTPCYMAPEQIRMGEITGRADQFSLAVIAYELWTGKRPFIGDSFATLVHQILAVEPLPANKVKSEIPGQAAQVLQKALSKEPTQRFESCTEFIAELRRAAYGGTDITFTKTVLAPPTVGDIPPAMRHRKTRRAWMLSLLLASTIAVIIGAYSAKSYRERNAGPKLTFSPMAHQAGLALLPALSPDGNWLAYAVKEDGAWNVYRQAVRPDGTLNPVRQALTSGAEDTYAAAYSPDGKFLAFRSERGGGGIFVMPSAGGPARMLTNIGYNPSWSPDGSHLCFSTDSVLRPEDRSTMHSKLETVDVNTGERAVIYGGDAVQPSWSPHGERIAFWFIHDGGVRDLATIPAQGGAPVEVTKDAAFDWNPVWSPDGKYLYFSSDRGGHMGLWRIRIDEQSGKVLSKPQLVNASTQNPAYISFSRDGKRFTFVERTTMASINKVAFDPASGNLAGEPSAITQGKQATRPDISADGKWIAFSSSTDRGEGIYVMDTDGTNYRPITSEVSRDRGPRWAPDGKHIAFLSNRSGKWTTWVVNSDGGNAQQISRREGALYPVWSPAGDRLVYTIEGDPSQVQSFIVTFGPKLNPTSMQSLPPLPQVDECFTPWSWSGDGAMLAGYTQHHDGHVSGIAVFDFRNGEYRRLTTFGSDPVWLHNSPRLLFQHNGKLYITDLRRSEQPREIMCGRYDMARRGFAVSPDDRWIYFSMEQIESDIWTASVQ